MTIARARQQLAAAVDQLTETVKVCNMPFSAGLGTSAIQA